MYVLTGKTVLSLCGDIISHRFTSLTAVETNASFLLGMSENCELTGTERNKPPEMQLEALTLVLAFQTSGSCSKLVAKGHLWEIHAEDHSINDGFLN